MTTFRQQFGRLILQRRTELGLSCTDVVRRCEKLSDVRFHVTVLRRWENGESIPTLEQVLWLANVLGFSLDDMLDPPNDGPWIDGSLATLQDLDDQIAGRTTVTTIDVETGLRESTEVEHPDYATQAELPEIPEEVR